MEQLELVMTEDDDNDIKTPELLVGRPQTLEEATNMFTGLDQIEKQSYIAKGYILRVVKDDCLYQEAGYLDIYDYAIRMGLAKHRGTVDKLMKINERFSMTGYSPFVADEYKMYNNSALQELYKMTDEEIEAAGITETMTVVKIREAKKEMMGEEPEIPEQIPGQMEITDIIVPTEDNNLVATSQNEQEEKIKVLTDFAVEYFEEYMNLKQHKLFKEGKEAEFVSYTKEYLLPLFNEEKDVLHYSIESGRIEISPDGYLKLRDGIVRNWREVYNRLDVLKVLRELPDSIMYGTFKKSIKKNDERILATPREIVRCEMAKAAVDELKTNHIEIPLDIDGIIKTVRDYYEPSYITFRCGYNAYMAETDGAGEVLTVHRLNSKTRSPEVRDIFEISIDGLAQEIDSIQNKNRSCDGNCFYCTTEEDCNCKQNKREKCIYDNNRNCNLYTAHEIAIKTGISCISSCCNQCEEKSCSVRCSYAREQENMINSTAQSHLEEKKSDWKHGIFENDNVAYGWARSEMVERLFERLEKQKLEIENIDGEQIGGPGNQRRYVFLSEDEAYVEFLRETEENKDEIDFKVSIERLTEEYEQHKNNQNVINTSAETDSETTAQSNSDNVIKHPQIDIIKEIAKDIISEIAEDESYETIELLTNPDVCREYLYSEYNSNRWMQCYCDGEIFEYETKPDDESIYVYKCSGNKEERTGAGFAWPINSLISEMFNMYRQTCKNTEREDKENVINTSAETDSETAAGGDNLPSTAEEIVEAEVITQPGRQTLPPAAGVEETVIKNIQYNGCTGQDEDGETTAETTITVNYDTTGQPELPRLTNNEQRKAWIEQFESWPLWIDNKETQERFYRYVFENGDIFVIRQAYSKKEHYNYKTRKSEKEPRWIYQREYIIRQGEDRTLMDGETCISIMIEYLKELQKKK